MSVEKFTLKADTIIHVCGIPCRLTTDADIETNPNNWPIIEREIQVWPSTKQPSELEIGGRTFVRVT